MEPSDRPMEGYPPVLTGGWFLVEIEKKDVDGHPSPLVFLAPHEDAPFPVLLARQSADE